MLIVGNWKMNCLPSKAAELAASINNSQNVAVVICPPFTGISAVTSSGLATGGQDCHINQSGANTGDISADMLKDLGCDYVIVGHSERRHNHGESNELVSKKALAAHKSGVKAIICIGESLEERDSGNILEILAKQLHDSIPMSADSNNAVIAYEPVWAIGTGKVATLEQIQEVHDYINEYVAEQFPLFTKPVNALYGGSVNADNAKEIMAIDSVGGVLVGGASLNADSFNKIIASAE